MAIGGDFEHVSALQLKVKALKRRVQKLEDGSAYTELLEEKRLGERIHRVKIRELEGELGAQVRLAKKMRKCWFEVFEQVEHERDEALRHAQASVKRMEERALRAERTIDCLTDAALAGARRIRELECRIEELEGTCVKLTAQVNRDFENSSLPSSVQGPHRKKIPNTRAQTAKKPGAQPGHPHHPRTRPTPTRSVLLADPDEFKTDADLYKTKDTLTKLVVSARLAVEVCEYSASVWRRHSNGVRTHAPFPDGVRDEVCYDGSVKALAFLLAGECCTSLAKVKAFLFEASGGALDLSCGMIGGLAREFASKNESERRACISSLLSAPVMHADFTGANVGGISKQVLILANKEACMLYARNSKGHKGIEASPLEGYVGCTVHDHDITFYSYGTSHQECMQHNIRYLVGSVQNEPSLTWNSSMLSLMREMIHWRHSLIPDKAPEPSIISAFEQRYDEILKTAQGEYANSPPTRYYRDGYNLYLRLLNFKESELRFLYDLRIPPDNSPCERLARVFKRKQHQSIVFRSFESLGYTCEAVAAVNNMRTAGKNVFEETVAIFNRPKPSRPSAGERPATG